MQIRKWTIGVAVAMAALVPLSLSSVAQAATKVDVLTISKAKGTNVKTNAVLTAGLASKTDVTFAAGALVVTCKTASLTFKVKSNSATGHTAVLSETKETISNCPVPSSLSTLVASLSITANKVAYTVSDKKGDPVTVAGSVATVKAVTTAAAGSTTVICIFAAKSIKGSYSNKTNGISFSKQVFTLEPVSKGSNSECSSVTGTTAKYSAVFGPVKDTSVKHSPKVFVN